MGNRALTVSNTAPKWAAGQPLKQQLQQLQLLPANRCRVDVVGAQTDMVTADDLANQLQFLKLKTKWTIDEDKYNSDAFDQCEGAWPIAHPLPLPLWSNSTKEPFVVENVSVILHIIYLFFLLLALMTIDINPNDLFYPYRFGNMKILLR